MVAILYKTCVRPQLSYGLTISSIPQKEINRLIKTEKGILCKFFGASYHSGSEVLYALLDSPPIQDFITRLSARWFARIVQAPDSSLIHHALRAAETIGRASSLTRCRQDNRPWSTHGEAAHATLGPLSSDEDRAQAATILGTAISDHFQQKRQERHLQAGHLLADNVPSDALLRLTLCPKLPRMWTIMYLVNRLPPYSPRCEACWTDRNQEAHVSRHHINDDCVVWTAFYASPDYIEPTSDKGRWWIDHCLHSAKTFQLSDRFFWSAMTFMKEIRKRCLGLGNGEDIFPWPPKPP